MKLKEISIGKSIKQPIPGVSFSSNESSYFETYALDDNEKAPTREELRKMWEKIKNVLADGLDVSAPPWLMSEIKEGGGKNGTAR